MRELLEQLKRYLLSGVSFVIPLVACGGILLAISFASVPMGAAGPDFSQSPWMHGVMKIGMAAFGLVVPVLAAYIAFGMVDKPGLVPGFVGGAIAHEIGAGFLGGMAAGLLAGAVVMLIKRIPVHRHVRPVMPILVIPVLSSLLVGGVLYGVIGMPIREVMVWMTEGLKSLQAGNQALLAALLGVMIAFDLGGPVNKAAFFFAAAMIKEGHPELMGVVAAAICTPPLGCGCATFLDRGRWTTQERESGVAALTMGAVGITEGAIPIAAMDPVRVLVATMAGSATAAVIAMLTGVANHAPHGGLVVLPVVDQRLSYVIAILAGTLVTAVVLVIGRRCRCRRPS